MAGIRTAHLMTLILQVGGMQAIGATLGGNRRVGLVSGGNNRIFAIGTGRRPPEGPVYEIFEVL
jgi:hypothetical protein